MKKHLIGMMAVAAMMGGCASEKQTNSQIPLRPGVLDVAPAPQPTTATLPQFARTLEYACARLNADGVHLHAVIAHSLGGSASAFAVGRGLATNSLVLIAAPDCPRDYTRMFAHVFGLGERTRVAMQRRIERRRRAFSSINSTPAPARRASACRRSCCMTPTTRSTRSPARSDSFNIWQTAHWRAPKRWAIAKF